VELKTAFVSSLRSTALVIFAEGRKGRNARDSSARSQAYVLPLVTFLGRARKVTRRPAGTGEVGLSDLYLVADFLPSRPVSLQKMPLRRLPEWPFRLTFDLSGFSVVFAGCFV
jgi:hypothetical protein